MQTHNVEELIKGEIADYWYDETNGILYAYSKTQNAQLKI